MIKKYISALSFVLSLLLIAMSIPVLAADVSETSPLGDINGDGKVTDWDAIALDRYLAGWDIAVDNDIVDMNGDGLVNSLDSMFLARYLTGWYESIDCLAKNALHISIEDGNDETGDGSANAPFATIERTKLKVREMLNSGATGEIIVYMHEGEYVIDGEYTSVGDEYLSEGKTSINSAYIVFTEEDSGNENCSVTYKSFYDDDVVITTAKHVLTYKDFVKADEEFTSKIRDESARDKIYMVDLKALGYDNINTNDDFFNIFYGDLMMDKARYPDRNFDDKENMYVKFITPNSDEYEKASGYYYVDDSVPFDSWDWSNKIEVRGFTHVDYFTGVMKVHKYKTSTYIDGAGETHDGVYKVYANDTPTNNLSHYYHNVPEELNFRGEYYINSDGILYIYADDDFEDVVISLTEFTPNGNTDYRLNAFGFENCDYYTFDGLIFTGIRGNAIYGYGNNLTIQNCVIKNLPDSALELTGDNILVYNNEIYNVGGEGICLFGSAAVTTLKSCNNVILNNLIHDFELITMCYNPAIYYTGNGVTISHNEIYNGTHAAVQGGGADCVFEYNYLHDVCYQGGDAGAMYIGGFDSPMLIRYNIFDNVVNHIGGGAPKAIYVDDGGSAKTIYGNIINCSGGVGIMIGGGSENVVQNNIVVGSRICYDQRGYFGQWQDVHGIYGRDDGSGWYWTHILKLQTSECDYRLWNIRYPYYYQLKSSNVKDETDHYLVGVCGGGVVQNNVCIWENPQLKNGVAGVGVASSDDASEALKLNGVYKDNPAYLTIEEVGFVDYENGNLALREDSKIYSDVPGFKAIPTDLIGRIA